MLSRSRKTLAILTVALLWLAFPSGTNASQFDKKTIFTIHQSMGIPGGMTLEPGTYVIKLVDSMSDRNTVQIWNEDETHLYNTVRAISKQVAHPVDRAELTFEAHSPMALKTWFYPGELTGWEFTYPKREVEGEMVMAAAQPEVQTPPVAAVAPEPEEPEAVIAESEEFAMAEPQAEAPPAVGEPYPAEAEPSAAEEEAIQGEEPAAVEEPEAAEELPETASPLPLLALFGIASLGIGGVVRFIVRRIS